MTRFLNANDITTALGHAFGHLVMPSGGDDTTAIQSAIEQSGSVSLVPNAVYNLSNEIILDQEQAPNGHGAILKMAATGSNTTVSMGQHGQHGWRWARLYNVILDGNVVARAANGDLAGSSDGARTSGFLVTHASHCHVSGVGGRDLGDAPRSPQPMYFCSATASWGALSAPMAAPGMSSTIWSRTSGSKTPTCAVPSSCECERRT
jgi:hypothetical protein